MDILKYFCLLWVMYSFLHCCLTQVTKKGISFSNCPLHRLGVIQRTWGLCFVHLVFFLCTQQFFEISKISLVTSSFCLLHSPFICCFLLCIHSLIIVRDNPLLLCSLWLRCIGYGDSSTSSGCDGSWCDR